MNETLDTPDLPEELQTLVENELADGETIAWMGQPVAKIFSRQYLPIVFFGIPWTAFAIFWTVAAAGFQVPVFQNLEDLFALFGVPFILVGLGMLSSPLWALRNARKTVYVITDLRAIVIEGRFRSHRFRSFAPDQLRRLTRQQNSDGSGDIIFERIFSHMNEGKAESQEVGFRGLGPDPGVKYVEDLLRELAATAHTDKKPVETE
jgi:hypothetical protein